MSLIALSFSILINCGSGDTTEEILFNVVCVESATSGMVTLTWDPSTTNTDGSSINDLAGYKVYYYGGDVSSFSAIPYINSTTTTSTSYTFTNMSSGTYYFAVTAVDVVDIESDYSNVICKKP